MKVAELLTERLKNSGEEVTITLRTTGDAKKRLAELLHHISRISAMGCSREWGMIDADGDKERKEYSVFFDGDGSDHLHDIKINGQHLKNFITGK